MRRSSQGMSSEYCFEIYKRHCPHVMPQEYIHIYIYIHSYEFYVCTLCLVRMVFLVIFFHFMIMAGIAQCAKVCSFEYEQLC